MLVGSMAQVLDIDVALGIAIYRHHLESSERRAGRIGSVRRGRDETDISFRLTEMLEVGSDH